MREVTPDTYLTTYYTELVRLGDLTALKYLSKHQRKRARRARRRYLENQRHSITWTKRRTIYERDGWKCRFCGNGPGRPVKKGKRTVLSLDHIIPVANGGRSYRTNLVTLCIRCNQRRDRVDIIPWLVGLTSL